jgi:hypothetical protein
VALAKAYFPACELTAETAEVYMLELADIAQAVGPEKAEAALRQACRSNRFFPSIGEIRDAAGLNPVLMAAAERDEAWDFFMEYARRWDVAGFSGVGVLEDTGEVVFKIPPGLPARIFYASEQAGGLKAVYEYHMAFAYRELAFARKAFDDGWDRFPYSGSAAEENLHPLKGRDQKELLKGVLAFRDRDDDDRFRPVPPGAKVISQSEWCQRQRKQREAQAGVGAVHGSGLVEPGWPRV